MSFYWSQRRERRSCLYAPITIFRSSLKLRYSMPPNRSRSAAVRLWNCEFLPSVACTESSGRFASLERDMAGRRDGSRALLGCFPITNREDATRSNGKPPVALLPFSESSSVFSEFLRSVSASSSSSSMTSWCQTNLIATELVARLTVLTRSSLDFCYRHPYCL